MEKFNKKLAGWKGKMLSQAGKVTLLRAYLQSLPTYALSHFKISTKFVDAIDKIKIYFLWSSTEEKKRMALIAWENVCKPKIEGGLGIRSIRSMNKAFFE